VEVMAHEDGVGVDGGGVERKGKEEGAQEGANLGGSSQRSGANPTQPLAHWPGHGTCPKLLE
jgi:hypothetical protein